MPDLCYSAIDERPLGVSVRAPGGWWDWGKSAWTSPFDPKAHILPCTRDTDRTRIQTATIPAAALYPGAFVVDWLAGPSPVELSTIGTPDNYLATGRGSLTVVMR